MRPRPSRGRAIAALVAGAHVALVVLFIVHTGRASVEVDRGRVMRLDIGSAARPRTEPPPSRLPTPAAPTPVRAPLPEVRIGPTPDADRVVAAPMPPSPVEPTAPASGPLRLDLSRAQLQGFAAAPRRPAEALRRVAKSGGERVAAAIEGAIGGPQDLQLEPMAGGGFRARFGGRCVLLAPSAMSRIDPVQHGNDPMLVRDCP